MLLQPTDALLERLLLLPELGERRASRRVTDGLLAGLGDVRELCDQRHVAGNPERGFPLFPEARACTRSTGMCGWRAWRWASTSCMRSVMRPSYFSAWESEGARRGSGVRSKPRSLRRSGWSRAMASRFQMGVHDIRVHRAKRFDAAEVTKRPIPRRPAPLRVLGIGLAEKVLRTPVDAVEGAGLHDDVHVRLPAAIGGAWVMHRPDIGMRRAKGAVEKTRAAASCWRRVSSRGREIFHSS